LLWKLDNLGFTNLALFRQRRAENKAALLELFRTQDRVAAEVVQAVAQAELAHLRAAQAEVELKNALKNVEQNLVGLENPVRKGDLILLLVRPQEVVAALQALGQAYTDYFGAVADANRAQFRLYRALGQPAQVLLNQAGDQEEPFCPHPAALGRPLSAPPLEPAATSP
jgi:hypothetical protein